MVLLRGARGTGLQSEVGHARPLEDYSRVDIKAGLSISRKEIVYGIVKSDYAF